MSLALVFRDRTTETYGDALFYLFDLVKFTPFHPKGGKMVIPSRDLSDGTRKTCMKAHTCLTVQLQLPSVMNEGAVRLGVRLIE